MTSSLCIQEREQALWCLFLQGHYSQHAGPTFTTSSNGCESWTIRKAECWRIGAFWTVVLEKTLESPLDRKKIKPVNPKRNQPWIFIGRTDAEAEAPIFFGHLIRKADSLEKTLMFGKTEGGRRRVWQRMRWLDGITNSMCMNLSKLWEMVKMGSLACCSPWARKESDTIEWLNNNKAPLPNTVYWG